MVVNNHFLATTTEIPIQVILLSVLQNDENGRLLLYIC